MSDKPEIKVLDVELTEEQKQVMDKKIRFVRVKDNTLTVYAKEPTGMVVDPALKTFREELKGAYKQAKDAFKVASSAQLKGTPMPQAVIENLNTAKGKLDAIKGCRKVDDAKKAVAALA